jgi:hypothetical protein
MVASRSPSISSAAPTTSRIIRTGPNAAQPNAIFHLALVQDEGDLGALGLEGGDDDKLERVHPTRRARDLVRESSNRERERGNGQQSVEHRLGSAVDVRAAEIDEAHHEHRVRRDTIGVGITRMSKGNLWNADSMVGATSEGHTGEHARRTLRRTAAASRSDRSSRR